MEAGDEVSAENLEVLDAAGIDAMDLLDIDHVSTGAWMRNTLKVDKAENRDEGLEAIYKVMRQANRRPRKLQKLCSKACSSIVSVTICLPLAA